MNCSLGWKEFGWIEWIILEHFIDLWFLFEKEIFQHHAKFFFKTLSNELTLIPKLDKYIC